MATAPSQVQPQDVGEIQAGLTLWEGKVKQLDDQFKDKLSDQMKVAIITSAMPNKVQDHILSQTTTKDPTFEETKEMILLYASRMGNCGGPTPMDVGNMQHQQHNQQQCQECNNGWQEVPWQEEAH